MKINMKFMLTCLHLYLITVGWVILSRLPYLAMVGSEHSVIKMQFYHVVSALSLGEVCSTFLHQFSWCSECVDSSQNGEV